MRKREPRVWFVAREGGISYFPVSWQGYAVLVGYVLLMSLSSLLILRSWGLFLGAVAVLTVLLFIILGMTSSDYS